jgi:hypothetical protein
VRQFTKYFLLEVRENHAAKIESQRATARSPIIELRRRYHQHHPRDTRTKSSRCGRSRVDLGRDRTNSVV